MARHNREGRGTDQRGAEYAISYQPDWLQSVKVTRELEGGRRSTKVLFRNPGWREQNPGPKARTQIKSPQDGLDFGLTLEDPAGVVQRVIIEAVVPREGGGGEEVVLFSVENRLPPPPPDDPVTE
jgi:hypothetical protein